MPLKDPARRREYRREYYHRAELREPQRLRSRALRARLGILLRELKDAPCLDCGGRFPSECMDFDHVRGAAKIRGVGQMVHISEVSLRSEIAKCDLVCANCHRIRTVARLRAATANRSA